MKKYKLIQSGDKIAVCISGGKDSMLLAKLVQELQKRSDIPFEAKYLLMDPGYNELNRQNVVGNAELLQIPMKIFNSDIYDVVAKLGGSPCYLCARMRRGHLYSYAHELGCNKIALGHHFNDVIETTLMGILYGGQFQAMLPKLHSTNFKPMELIRPLYCVREKDIISWKKHNELEFIQCACRFTENCSALDTLNTGGSKRKRVKDLIATLSAENEYVEKNIFNSIHMLNLDTVLGYKKKGQKHYFIDSYDEE